MPDKFIISERPVEKNPFIALLLSVLVTGLGQLYYGAILKGIVFFLLRLLPILVVPLYAASENKFFSINTFAILALFHLSVWITGALEVFINRGRGQESGHSTTLIVTISGIAGALLLFLSIVNMSLFFSIDRVMTDSMKPTIENGEFVLVNMYSAGDLNHGHVVAYTKDGDTRYGRIIAKGNEKITYNRGQFTVNGMKLPFGVLSDRELEKLGYDNVEEIFFEINGDRKYGIINRFDSTVGHSPGKIIRPGKNNMVIASDNRTGEKVIDVINIEVVEGIVEGIVFSTNVKRFLLLPYIGTQGN